MWKQFKMVCYCSNQQWMIYCLSSVGTSFMVVPAEDEQEVQMDVLQGQASWLSFNLDAYQGLMSRQIKFPSSP